MNRRSVLVAAGSTLVTGLAGCLDGSAETTDNEVTMSIDSFRPNSLTVTPGTTVTFNNTSSHTHTVTAFQDDYPEDTGFWSTGDFDSEGQAVSAWRDDGGGALEPGNTYERSFDVTGTYRYYCIPHLRANMTGEIVVEE